MAYYYTRDHLGSVRELVNGSGTILTRYTYDPYGRTTTNHLVTSPSTTDSTFQYAGYYAHQASGLNLTLAGDGQSTGRAYDAGTGRWLSRDPIGEEQGADLYAYVGDSPIDWNDSLGLAPKTPHPPDPVAPYSSDFPFIYAPYDNFHWYGYWGGPHVTSGSRKWAEAENFPNDPKDPDFKPPIDDRDTCYYRHDVCLHNAGTIKDPGLRQAARAGCDHSLASCLCKVTDKHAATTDEINQFRSYPGHPSANDNPGEYYPNAKPYPYLYP